MGIDAAARNNSPHPLVALLSRQGPLFGMPPGLPSRDGGGHLDLAMSYEIGQSRWDPVWVGPCSDALVDGKGPEIQRALRGFVTPPRRRRPAAPPAASCRLPLPLSPSLALAPSLLTPPPFPYRAAFPHRTRTCRVMSSASPHVGSGIGPGLEGARRHRGCADGPWLSARAPSGAKWPLCLSPIRGQHGTWATGRSRDVVRWNASACATWSQSINQSTSPPVVNQGPSGIVWRRPMRLCRETTARCNTLPSLPLSPWAPAPENLGSAVPPHCRQPIGPPARPKRISRARAGPSSPALRSSGTCPACPCPRQQPRVGLIHTCAACRGAVLPGHHTWWYVCVNTRQSLLPSGHTTTAMAHGPGHTCPSSRMEPIHDFSDMISEGRVWLTLEGGASQWASQRASHPSSPDRARRELTRRDHGSPSSLYVM